MLYQAAKSDIKKFVGSLLADDDNKQEDQQSLLSAGRNEIVNLAVWLLFSEKAIKYDDYSLM